MFTQLRIFAQDGMGGWVDLLVLVAMAVFWALAGLLRAGARKRQQSTRAEVPTGQQRQKETWQQRLARKAEEMQRAIEEKGREGAERMRQMGETHPARRPASDQPPPGRIAERRTSGGESVLVYEHAEPSAGSARHEEAVRHREAKRAVTAAMRAGRGPAPVRTPGDEPILESMTSITREPSKSLDLGTEELDVPHGPAGYAPESVIDYSDPDALKKAILHYEIIGKPLALRDLGE